MKESHQTKIHYFIQNNDFTILDKNYTNKYQEDIRNTINTCSTIIPKGTKWNLINLNPFLLTLKGLIKIHKTDAPIRPIINLTQAPVYKIPKKLVTFINNPAVYF